MIIGDSRHLARFTRVILLVLTCVIPSFAQHNDMDHGLNHDHGGSQTVSTTSPLWEGSPEGRAYSEFNHRLAGVAVIMIGLTELHEAVRLSWLPLTRFLLPASMLGAGAYFMIWSDHDAWPVGSLSFTQTFSGADLEMVQHKIYTLLMLSIGTIELFRRAGYFTHLIWRAPLPLFAIIGGLLLFAHLHGPHPSAHKIALHHAVIGTMAVLAGSSKLASTRVTDLWGTLGRVNWSLVWAGFILLIGIQLLVYSE